VNIRGPLTPEFEGGSISLDEQMAFLNDLQTNQLSLARSVA